MELERKIFVCTNSLLSPGFVLDLAIRQVQIEFHLKTGWKNILKIDKKFSRMLWGPFAGNGCV
jgi:hypothetical protein